MQAVDNWKVEYPIEYYDIFSNDSIDKDHIVNSKIGYLTGNINVQSDYVTIFYNILGSNKSVKMKYEYIVDMNGNTIDDVLKMA